MSTFNRRPGTSYILSLDGGGIRGYLSASLLKLFCERASIPQSELFNYFDLICGTSIGGIQAIGYALGKSPQNLMDLFRNEAGYIFRNNSETERNSGKSVYFAGVVTGTNSGAMEDDEHTYLGDDGNNCLFLSSHLEDVLTKQFGSHTMGDLKTKCFVTALNSKYSKPLLLSNIILQDSESIFDTSHIKLVDTARATSAAPLYFPYKEFSGNQNPYLNGKMLDGGVFENNPELLGLEVSRLIKPSARRVCLLSIGTGAEKASFDPTIEKNPGTTYNAGFLKYLLGVFLAAPSEMNSTMMDTFRYDYKQNIYYLRYDYQFTEQETKDGYSDLDGCYTYDNVVFDRYAKNYTKFFSFYDSKVHDIFFNEEKVKECDLFISHFFA